MNKKIFSANSMMLLLAAAIWGVAFVAQKAAAEVPVFTLCASRSVIAALALIPLVMLSDKLTHSERRLISKRGLDITKRERIGGALSGFFLFVATALQQAGIGGTDPGKASFITALYVVIVPIFALFFKKKSPSNAWIGVAISVVGFYLLCVNDAFTVAIPDLLVFACAFVFAMQILTIDILGEGTDGFRFSLIQFSTVSVLSLICALIFEQPIDFSAIGAGIHIYAAAHTARNSVGKFKPCKSVLMGEICKGCH